MSQSQDIHPRSHRYEKYQRNIFGKNIRAMPQKKLNKKKNLRYLYGAVKLAWSLQESISNVSHLYHSAVTESSMATYITIVREKNNKK